MRRILIVSLLFSVICALWVSTARASTAIKLCGSANGLADSLIISGLFDQDGPFVMHTAWVQFVPGLYTLLGGGAVIRTIGDVTTFSGGLTVTNNSALFANNPTCAVSPVLSIDQLQPLQVSGTAELRCIGGPGDPFTVTISFTLVSCNDPGPFGVSSEQSVVSAFQGSPGAETKPAAGYAPNEYRAP
jgi:hypothetical protein